MASSEINLIISYESEAVETLKCNSDDKLENVLKKFAEIKNMENPSFMILYGGKNIQGDDLKKSLSEIMTGLDKQDLTMNILLYRNIIKIVQDKSNINIILIIDSRKVFVLQGKREDKLKDILIKNNSKINSDINSLIFKYGNKNVDLDKKFEEIANNTDKNFCGMTLNAYTQNKLIVNFEYNNFRQFRNECNIEDNIRNICNIYCKRFGKNINELTFRYRLFNINLDQTFEELLAYNEDIKSKNNIIAQEEDLEENNIKEINIIVIDNESSIKKYKKLIIIISIILVIIIIIIIVVVSTSKEEKKEDSNSGNKNPGSTKDSTKETNIPTNIPTTKPIKICNPGYFIPIDDETLEDCVNCSLDKCVICNGTYENNECISCGDLTNIYENGKIIECKNSCEIGPGEKCLTCEEDKIECKSCNTGYKLINGKCRPDFLIEAVFQTNADGDVIDLFSINNNVIQMIIDGENITAIRDKRQYLFKKAGNHTVYLKFRKRYDYSYSYTNVIFFNSQKLIYAAFSDFDEYISDISFNNLFQSCTNLISVDLSKIAMNTKGSSTYMFEGCTNLVFVNFNLNFYQARNSMANMFKDCRSLKSIDLSKLDVSEVSIFNNMFSGCSSLTSVNLGSFKLEHSYETSMKNMFLNCISLKYLDLSSFQPFKLTTIESAFYNCHSLTSINLQNFYTSRMSYMSYAFSNCTSLKFLDLSSFNTENVETMAGMFEYCTSLTSINFGSNFNTNKVYYMDSLFYHCHSLESIDYPIIANNINNLTFVFSDCYSLKSVNLQKFNTTNSRYLQNLFHNCYSLKSIDISTFRFRYSPTLSNMFSGCYSLTSVDFSKVNSNKVTFDKIFYDCPSLSFVNFSFCTNNGRLYNEKLFNDNISSTGNLILNSSVFNSDTNQKPDNWNLELI